jgi:heptaprenyl diphosphate synthase
MWENQPWVREEMTAFEAFASERFAAKGVAFKEISARLLLSGGKRLRPAMTILAAKSGDYDRARVFPAALAVETLHAATLAHDDIVDGAVLRRGEPTVSDRHGVNMAVYTGDYLFAKSLLLMAESGLEPERTEWVAKAVLAMCEGEMAQYLGRYEIASIPQYLRRIARKTGLLFSAACAIGGKAGHLADADAKRMARFGFRFGMAFQIRDDLLDMGMDESLAGKPVERDLKDGIATLPVLFALRRSTELEPRLRDCFAGRGDMTSFLDAVRQIGGTQDADLMLGKYTEKCRKLLSELPRQTTRNALEELTEWLTSGSESLQIQTTI